MTYISWGGGHIMLGKNIRMITIMQTFSIYQ